MGFTWRGGDKGSVREREQGAGETQRVLVDRLYLQTHVIRQQREEVVLHVAVDERVPERPVQQEIPGQVQNPVAHLVDPLRSAGRGEHVQADVLKHTHTHIFLIIWLCCCSFLLESTKNI